MDVLVAVVARKRREVGLYEILGFRVWRFFWVLDVLMWFGCVRETGFRLLARIWSGRERGRRRAM